ncbi:MAG: hypothetical protein UY13_C0002G0359 [Candidatus Pacebacteria bacterium GW2011_GWB1_47_8]|nr:MAG: hypothetical protein UX28_C0001G0507 [Candidatus Pacebacteria bacterium GW2011_GWA1_46_10]KKU84447.1 MAG: hypothetical protein UY13_C0002G0359 [Candidatus Pacebacteria bacterium GW2011_GWB1_47_8]HCR81121.1 hypothetical protein [Candidatus Paceibacterota bacterium]
MPQYLLQAGNTPSLSRYEAAAVMGDSVEKLNERTLLFTAPDDQAAKSLFQLLGASIRLVRLEREWQTYTESKLEAALVELLTRENPAKLQFTVAQWGDRDTTRISQGALKAVLAEKGIKSRFIEGARDGLSAAVLLNQEVMELVVVQQGKKMLLGTTLVVQDIDHWTAKDRGKPYADRKKGMLPPKIARAMVNLALGNTPKPGVIVYDPFCGTGTVLMEALERGAHVVGSDLAHEAAVGAQTNLAWFADRFHLPAQFQVFQSEVTHVTLNHLPGKIDAIVTEPFLGKPQPKPNELPGMFRGLEKLYLGAFHQWRSLLRPGATVVVIFPRVELPNRPVFDCQNFVDRLATYGYTRQIDFGQIRYHRPQAIVQRDIVMFQYQ